MGRGNTLARVARAKERLELAAQAQADIAKQAVEAIENGADPELVVDIAKQAANAVELPPVDVSPVAEAAARLQEESEKQKLDQDTLNTQEQVSIRIVDTNIIPAPSVRTGTTESGKRFEAVFNADGIALVAKEVADRLVGYSNGKFAYVEE